MTFNYFAFFYVICLLSLKYKLVKPSLKSRRNAVMYELGANLVLRNTLVQVIAGLKFRCDGFASPPKILLRSTIDSVHV